MSKNIEMNYKMESGEYEVLYPVTLSGNITDLESYLSSRYYSKSEIDGFNAGFSKTEYGVISYAQNAPYNRIFVTNSISDVSSIKGMMFELNIYIGGGASPNSIKLKGSYLRSNAFQYGLEYYNGTYRIQNIPVTAYQDYFLITVITTGSHPIASYPSTENKALLIY